MPTMSQLHGLSYRWAHMFGMPNLGAHYTPRTREGYESNGAYALDSDTCVLCGRRAQNTHHVVPRSVANTFTINGHMLRSPLMALCGSGTTGCHDGFHGGSLYEARWVWDRDEDMWWDGTLLEEYRPHDPRLYRHGHWEIVSKRNGAVMRVTAPI